MTQSASSGSVRRRQYGGTFLGFVLGVVVGLAAALAVAVYVTKVPVPFMNKMPQRSAEQDAAEAQRNRNWDPNAPLYGKPAARPAAPPASAVAPFPPAASAPAAATVPAAPGRPASAAAAAADPLGDLARARAGLVGGTGDTAADPFLYYVQAGAFRTADDANAQRAKLALAGVDAKVSERDQSGRPVFRVRAGPFERKEEADQVRDKLGSAGFDSAVVRVQR